MPFADYSSFEDCVRKNSDKRDSEAYCAVIKRQTEGKLDYSEEELLALKDTLDLDQTEFMKALAVLDESDHSVDSKAELTEEERTPPETAQDNAQTALDARDEVGGDCGTDTGWARANQLASGEPLSEDTIERMAQFNRHRDNSEMDDDEGRADCGWQMWQAWGGDEGIDWAIRMSDRMDEMDGE